VSGDEHLLRDLRALDLLTARRPGAATRLQRELGDSTAHLLVTALARAIAPPAPRRAHG